MSTENIKPERITKPIQLLAAWLLGLILINGSFLAAAAQITHPFWASSALIIATIANVPVFLASLFLLQTKFRPEMQEDTYYSKYLERKYSTPPSTKEIIKFQKEEENETDKLVELITKKLDSKEPNRKLEVKSILLENEKNKIQRMVSNSRALSELFLHEDEWSNFSKTWEKDDSFKRDLERLLYFKVIEGDIDHPANINLTKLGKDIASNLNEEKLLWNQTRNKKKTAAIE